MKASLIIEYESVRSIELFPETMEDRKSLFELIDRKEFEKVEWDTDDRFRSVSSLTLRLHNYEGP